MDRGWYIRAADEMPNGRWGILPSGDSNEVGVAVYVRTYRAAAMRALLDWHQMAAGQLVQDGDRVRYHDGARPAMPGRPNPIQCE